MSQTKRCSFVIDFVWDSELAADYQTKTSVACSASWKQEARVLQGPHLTVALSFVLKQKTAEIKEISDHRLQSWEYWHESLVKNFARTLFLYMMVREYGYHTSLPRVALCHTLLLDRSCLYRGVTAALQLDGQMSSFHLRPHM